jgi:hypothetical protein
MIAGPFDLSSAFTAYLDLDFSIDTEGMYNGIAVDGLAALFSTDGVNFYGVADTGTTGGGFVHKRVNLKSAPGPAGPRDITGEPYVWVAFEFFSDDTIQYEGVYVDEVRIAEEFVPLPAGWGIPSISSISPRSASAGTGSLVTIAGAEFGNRPSGYSSVNFPYCPGRPLIPVPIVSWSDTSIVAEVPAGTYWSYPYVSASSGPVTVTNYNGGYYTSPGYDFGVTFGYGQHRWESNEVTYRVNANTGDTTGEEAMIDAAAATWSVPSPFRFMDGGASTASGFVVDGHNVLFWSASELPTGVIAATSSVYDSSGTFIVENDVCFNDAYPWGDGSTGTMDAESIALHELGHWLCLLDLYGPADSAKAMYGFGSPGVTKRSLSGADQEGILWIYGPPRITGLTPSSGPSAGGNTVVISGNGFKGVTGENAITFGGDMALGYTVVSPTRIEAVAPPHAPGPVQVQVVTASGITEDAPADDYTYLAASGSYEQTDARIRYSAGWETFYTSSASGGSYGRASASGSSATVYFKGIGLDWIAMKGTTTGKADVYLDDAFQQTVDLYNPSAIYQVKVWSTPVLPYGFHKVKISVNPSTVGKYITLDRVEVLGELTQAPPAITSISPTSGLTLGGTSVTITGSGFIGVSEVKFGDTKAASYLIDSDTQMRAIAPAHAEGTVSVRLKSPGGSSTDTAADDYTYTLPVTPTITSLSPTSGSTAGGTSVTINGTGFDLVSSVLFGDEPAVSYVVNSPTKITAVAPSHAEGTVRVRVTAVGGTTADTAADDYTYVAAVAPTRYDQTDPNIVKTGTWTDFASTASYLGSYGRSSTSGARATVWFTGTKIAWIGMKGSTPGIVDVWIDDVKKATLDLYASPAVYQKTLWTSDTLESGTHRMDLVRNSGSLSTEYLVLDAVDIWGAIKAPPLAITSLSPTTGSIAGGTSVVINGSGFIGLSGASAVTFGGTNATSYVVNSSSKITAVAPAHAPGTVSVKVTAAGGSTPDTAADDFTYVTTPSTTTRYEETSSSLVWTGTWTLSSSTAYSGGSHKYANASGASVTATINGTYVALITKKGANYGIAKVTVDGTTTHTVDLYRSTTGYKQKAWEATLPAGYHTVKVEWTGTKNPASTGTNISVDAFDVAGSLVSSVRTEQTSTKLTYAGTWTTGTSSYYSGSSFKYINKTGSVTINFTGVSLSLVAKKAANYGIAKVTLDGTKTFNVDFYSATTYYKKTVWSSGFLTPGDHSVKIEWTGTKRAVATGTNINIDAVDVRGVLR